MRYVIEDEAVYSIEQIGRAEIKASIGSEKRLELISESDKEKVYQWQKFAPDKGEYIADEENIEPVEIDGKEYNVSNGKIIVPKEYSDSEARIKHLEEELEKKDLENKIALAEVYDMILKKGGGASE